ncbi:hypothetical protein DENSPDRAFT_850536 [Dentipellis sp. KUC8613]|nr:hypothetical protein DENSPDRAFT_850536 [Dentipellis sp. KUC8613]
MSANDTNMGDALNALHNYYNQFAQQTGYPQGFPPQQYYNQGFYPAQNDVQMHQFAPQWRFEADTGLIVHRFGKCNCCGAYIRHRMDAQYDNPSFAEAQNTRAHWLANFAVQAPSNPGLPSGADADLARENERLRAQLREAHEALADARDEAVFLQGSVDSMRSSLADIDQGRERRRKTSHAAPAPYAPTPSPAAPPPYNALAGPSTSRRPDDTRRPDLRHDKRRHDERRHEEHQHEERRRDERRYDCRDHPDDAPRRHSRDNRRPERHDERRRDRSPSRDHCAGPSTASTDTPRAEDNRPQRPLPRRATPASASAAPPKSAMPPPPEVVTDDTVPVAQRQLGKLAAPPPIGNGPLGPALLYSGDPNTQYAWPRYLLATKRVRWAMHTGNQIPLGDIPSPDPVDPLQCLLAVAVCSIAKTPATEGPQLS